MADSTDQAARWIAELGLEPLAGESGWWRPAGGSEIEVGVGGTVSQAFSAIYYLLDARRPISVWHHLESDDTQVLIDGGPVEYTFLRDGRAPARIVFGREVAAGHVPMLTAPGGTWKALRLVDPSGYALMASIVTPAWTPSGVRIGLPVDEARRWTGPAEWLTAAEIDRLGRP